MWPNTIIFLPHFIAYNLGSAVVGLTYLAPKATALGGMTQTYYCFQDIAEYWSYLRCRLEVPLYKQSFGVNS